MESVPIHRRAVLAGIGLGLLAPRGLGAASRLEREHTVELELPILSEEPAAVPIRVAVAHPMEPDHFIQSIAVVAERDPVSDKGTFHFTPANGQPWVAFHMRSGQGGPVRATATCSRHGTFAVTRELRVVEGGCTTAADTAGRSRIGSPMLRLPRAIRTGEVIEVRAKVDHGSHTGLALRDGKFAREAPAFYVTQMLVDLDDERVSAFEMTSAVSANPLVRFPLKVTRGGRLRVVFLNNEGERWEVAHQLAV